MLSNVNFTFTLWVGLGAALGLWRLAVAAPRQSAFWVNIGLIVLLLSLVGARLGFVFYNRIYFMAHPFEIPMVWLGGLTWPGAVSGMFLGLVFLAAMYPNPRTRRISIGWISDQLYPLLPPVVVAAWLGCWQIGAAYGPAAPDGAWWAVPGMDENGVILRRWPVQLTAAVILLVFFVVVERWMKPYKMPGRLSGTVVFGLLMHFLFFSFVCADPSPYWNNLRLDSWAAIIFLLLFNTYLILKGLAAYFKRRVLRSTFNVSGNL